MAILDRGILGGGRNAVGTVVMTKWRGKDVIRARVTPANPRTDAQTDQRDLFALLTQAGATLLDAFVRPYWRRYEGTGRSATTAFNEFVRANVFVMRAGSLPEPGTFDAAKLLLTRGPLEPAEPLALADERDGVRVTWDASAGAGSDAVAVVVTRLDGSLVLVHGGANRRTGEALVAVASRDKLAFHVVAYRPGLSAGETAVGFHGSVRYDADADADIVVTAAEKAAAYAARRSRARGGDAAPAPALV